MTLFDFRGLAARALAAATLIMIAYAAGAQTLALADLRAKTHIHGIAVDPKESETTKVAKVVIPVAQAAVAAPGVAYRMDHIPLPMKKVVDSPYPSDRELLDRLTTRILEKQQDGQCGRGRPRR